MNKYVVTIVGTAITMAATALVVSVANFVDSRRTRKKIEESLSRVETMTEDQIAETVIRRAVEKAADKKMDHFMQDTEEAVLRTASRNLDIQAKKAVDSYADDIREKAASKITEQVEHLDIEDLKRRVCNQAERHVMDKLDGVLDSSTRKFEAQLDSTRKVYDGIAKAMADKERGDDGFRFVVL